MLVLTRRKGERIIIADQIEVLVIAVQGNQVRLGFEAPRDVAIHREEIHQDSHLSGKGRSGQRGPPGPFVTKDQGGESN